MKSDQTRDSGLLKREIVCLFQKRGSFFCHPYKVALWHHDVESLVELRAEQDMDFERKSLLFFFCARNYQSLNPTGLVFLAFIVLVPSYRVTFVYRRAARIIPKREQINATFLRESYCPSVPPDPCKFLTAGAASLACMTPRVSFPAVESYVKETSSRFENISACNTFP